MSDTSKLERALASIRKHVADAAELTVYEVQGGKAGYGTEGWSQQRRAVEAARARAVEAVTMGIWATSLELLLEYEGGPRSHG